MPSLADHCLEKIHTRNIEIATFGTGDGESIIVEGTLRDQRRKSSYTVSGDRKSPGVVHHLVIRMKVAGPGLQIRAIEVEMPGTPRGQCPETQDSLEPIVGMHIAPGFTEAVKKIAGGNKGCAHLTSLMITMAPAAVQGFWAHYSQKPIEGHAPHEAMEKFLLDTCHVWRKDGPLMRELLAEVRQPLDNAD
jgi:hypothetical protein